MILVCGLVGCSGKPPGPPPNPLAFSIDTPMYTVQSAEEKRYFCYTTHLSTEKDLFITQIMPVYGRATHHLGVYYTLAAEPDGVFDCPELVRATWVPLYGGGVQSGTVQVPDGAAFHLAKGQQILVQLHLLNSSPSTVTDKATINFLTTDKPNPTPAGIFGMSDTQISIAANSPGDAAMDCPVTHPLNVFAVFGHMHQLGTHIELTKGTGGPSLFAENWDFNNQPTVPMTFSLVNGDSVHLHCQYDNTTGAAVGYGESSFNEMCAFVLYYTPYTGLDGCM
jgi:hypothetical protein